MLKKMLAFFILIIACKENKQLLKHSIVEIYTFTKTEQSNYKIRRFILNNFEKDFENLILRYTDSLKQQIDTIFNQIDYVFYKESKITNFEHLNKNPKDLDRYSQDKDMILIITKYKESKNIYVTKYKNGEIISPEYKKIKIE